MAADEQITGTYRLKRETIGGSSSLLVDSIDYSMLDETDPKTSVFVNGGAPVGGGIKVYSTPEFIHQGEYLLVEGKPDATKQLDSVGAASHVLLIGVRVTEVATGRKYNKFLNAANRDQSRVPDDGSKTLNIWNPFWAFQVPNGERWQLFDILRINARTAA